MMPNCVTQRWNYPTDIRVGAGAAGNITHLCIEKGMASPLVVTDKGMAESDVVKEILSLCREADLNVALFSNLEGNPGKTSVKEGINAFISGDHDGVIAIGGGSALDVGKTIAVAALQNLDIWDLDDNGSAWQYFDPYKMVNTIAIPTTAGTGSEVGRAAVITDEESHTKRVLFHPRMLPAVVVLDPKVTVGLPRTLTAATGMDALSHALEAYCSPSFHPMGEGIALNAIYLVHEHLVQATENGEDLTARMGMLTASMMGATAFQKGLGAMHALAHPLGAIYGSHHGLLNAILMPYVLVANRAAIESKICVLARYLDLENHSFEAFVSWILELRETLGIPHSLADIGINDGQAEKIGLLAKSDPSDGGNPVSLSAVDYSKLFIRAVNGLLEG
ncbi:iron-containing alcohol dehydrogenase [Parasalinivibrio latis]|uniref:iron-containing alcohol dehydrogenase n=1 Tax=Parasalinivibrio latis TaxID=2952610 RepID=UPI0030DE8F98